MRMITIDDGRSGELALNLDLVTYARLYPGKDGGLLLHFPGEEKNTLNVGAPNAGNLWVALTRT